MRTDRDALRAVAEGIEPRGDAEHARRRGDQLRRRRRLVVSAVACLAALLGGGVIAALADGDERNSQIDVLDRPSTTSTPVAPGSTAVDGDAISSFGSLPPPPVPIDRGTAVVPTPEALVVWGSDGGRQGALLQMAEIETRGQSSANGTAWKPMAEAPAELGVGPATAVATDSMVIVLTGDPHGENARAAAYDVRTNSWRRVPDAPFRRGEAMTVGWSGQEAIFYGVGLGDCVAEHQGFAYHPGRNEWRQIADPPFGVRAGTVDIWDGGRLVVLGGSQQRCSIEPANPQRDGAMYWPATDTWSEIPPLPSGDPVWGIGTGEGVVVFDNRCTDDCSSAAVLDVWKREWRDLGADGPAVNRRLTVAHLMGLYTWDTSGRGQIMTFPGLSPSDGPALPADLAADPSTLHLVAGGRFYALAPGRAAVFPSQAALERIYQSLDASTVADAVKLYATHPSFKPFEQVPFADEVEFAFRSTVVGHRRAEELADDQAWQFDYPDGTFEGTFSVLELLRDGKGPHVRSGDFDRCDGSPSQRPPGADDMFRTAYIYNASSTCERWWAIVVYVRDGQIAVISYDRGS